MVTETFSRAIQAEIERAVPNADGAALVFLAALAAHRAGAMPLCDAVRGTHRVLRKIAASRYDAETRRFRWLRRKAIAFVAEVVAVDNWLAGRGAVSTAAAASIESVSSFVAQAKGIDAKALREMATTILRHVPITAGRWQLVETDVQAVAGWLMGHLPAVTQALIAILRERGGRAIELPELAALSGFTAPAFAYAARKLGAAGLANVRTVRRGRGSVTLIALSAEGSRLLCEGQIRAHAPVTALRQVEGESVDAEGLVL